MTKSLFYSMAALSLIFQLSSTSPCLAMEEGLDPDIARPD